MTILDNFKQLTGKDLNVFFSAVTLFFTNDYPDLVNYYTGTTQSITPIPYKNLDSISTQLDEIYVIFNNFSSAMTNAEYYVLLDIIENIDSRIKTTQNINRWARSTKSVVAYSPNGVINYTLSDKESLEKVAQNLLNSQNPEDDWYDIAMENHLAEEDYTSEGGKNINVPGNSQSISSFPLNSVVDVINGKTVYGKDIYKNFSIQNNDVVVLDYDGTLSQSVDTLITLKKNSNPDFRTEGLQTSLVIGGTRNTLNFPVIVRQLTDTFSTDDTLKNFQVTNIQPVGNQLQISYTVRTRLGEILQLTGSI